MNSIKQNKLVAFRVDAGSVGLGHIMRNLPIAVALRRMGCEVLFVSKSKSYKPLLEQQGFELALIGNDSASFMGELPDVTKLIRERRVSFTFVDTFYADNGYFRALGDYCKVGTMGYGYRYSDGLDLIVSYLFSTDFDWYARTFSELPTRTLVGLDYVPIRSEFSTLDFVPASAKSGLLISTGGTDDLNICMKLLRLLDGNQAFRDMRKHVVVGPSFRHKTDLQFEFGLRDDVSLHYGKVDLWNVFKECRVALSSFGFTVYELAASGVPVIAFGMSDEQVDNAVETEFIDWMGDVRFNTRQVSRRSIRSVVARASRLVSDNCLCDAMQHCALNSGIDGFGARRIASQIVDIIENA